jgi:hypothetical protein
MKEYLGASQEERDDLRDATLKLLAKGKSPSQIATVISSAGWSRDMADWYAHLTSVHGDALILVTNRAGAMLSSDPPVWPWFAGGLTCIAIVAVTREDTSLLAIALVAAVAQLCCFARGLSLWATNKGHSSSYGFLALCPLVGILMVALLTDRRRESQWHEA